MDAKEKRLKHVQGPHVLVHSKMDQRVYRLILELMEFLTGTFYF